MIFMNGKKARSLRRTVKEAVGTTPVEYQEVVVRPSNMKRFFRKLGLGLVGMTEDGVKEPAQRLLSKDCGRYWYKQAKKEYKNA